MIERGLVAHERIKPASSYWLLKGERTLARSFVA
jgi:hypothetical protein